jgi:hypothetical protein
VALHVCTCCELVASEFAIERGQALDDCCFHFPLLFCVLWGVLGLARQAFQELTYQTVVSCKKFVLEEGGCNVLQEGCGISTSKIQVS